MGRTSKKYRKQHLKVIRTEDNERIGVFRGNQLIGFTGDTKKGIKADLGKIEYLYPELPFKIPLRRPERAF